MKKAIREWEKKTDKFSKKLRRLHMWHSVINLSINLETKLSIGSNEKHQHCIPTANSELVENVILVNTRGGVKQWQKNCLKRGSTKHSLWWVYDASPILWSKRANRLFSKWEKCQGYQNSFTDTCSYTSASLPHSWLFLTKKSKPPSLPSSPQPSTEGQ